MFDENKKNNKKEKEKLFYIREMKEEEYMKIFDENKKIIKMKKKNYFILET